MREGMYVVLDGTPMQVNTITVSAITGPRGVTHHASIYALIPVGGGAITYVTKPGAGAPPWLDVAQYPTFDLTPPCDPCGRPAGHGTCALDGNHAGPLPAHEPATPRPVNPWAKDGPCRCGEADCGECGRAGHRRWTA